MCSTTILSEVSLCIGWIKDIRKLHRQVADDLIMVNL